MGKRAEVVDGHQAGSHEKRQIRPSESLHKRGHYTSHIAEGKAGEVTHAGFHALDHGMKLDHMPARTGKADGKHGNGI